jgi:hypothetical protein
LAAAILKKCGDSGDKLEELRFYAGLRRFEVRGQNGDKAGTVRGQYQYVKKITHSHTFTPFFFAYLRLLPSLVLPCPLELLALVPGFGGLFQ